MKLRTSALAVLLFSGSLAAQDIKITGTLTQRVHTNGVNGATRNAVSPSKTKDIVLLNIQLSDKAQQDLAARAKNTLAHPQQFLANTANKTDSQLPVQIQLGMNKVPVLDQGAHGTCVTFAVTAAVDALLKEGDYISQLCQLQLGVYLSKNGYNESGWDGTWGRTVLGQMEAFGFVSKKEQETQGCGGLTQYPQNVSETPNAYMTPEEFRQISQPFENEQVGQYIAWSTLLDMTQTALDRQDPETILNKVKATLNSGDRVTFGSLLWDVDLGVAGAVGSKEQPSDTWVLTPEIARDVYLHPFNFAGHEMVLTGYDNKAVATDDKGRKHYGLLTIRNSWGPTLGNGGDFYMSYDYFKMFVIEAARIHLMSGDD